MGPLYMFEDNSENRLFTAEIALKRLAICEYAQITERRRGKVKINK